MKRILTALLATTMVLSLAACGTTNETTNVNNSTESEDIKITIEDPGLQNDPVDDTESSSEVTVTTTETTVPEEPEVPVELPLMNTEPELIMNGCMAFKCDGKNYVYNITDNELYETEYDVDDITVLNGCIAVIGDVHAPYEFKNIDASIINLKTGEQYADVRPFYNSDWNSVWNYDCDRNSDYLVVGTLKESFSGNTVSIGILNNKGEWLYPLSEDYAICNVENIDKARFEGQYDKYINIVTDNCYCVYDTANDKTIMIDNYDGITMNSITMTNNGMVMRKYNYDKNEIETYHYDIATGDSTYIDNMACVFNINMSIKDGTLKVYDENYNFVGEYNISEYDVSTNDVKGATEDLLVFKTRKNHEFYTVILDTSNNFVCEPIKGASVGNPHFSENKIVFVSDDADRIIDINTGEITEYDSTFDIIDYDDTNDLMLVNTNGSYYLVDPEAPDTLINPFERVNG